MKPRSILLAASVVAILALATWWLLDPATTTGPQAARPLPARSLPELAAASRGAAETLLDPEAAGPAAAASFPQPPPPASAVSASATAAAGAPDPAPPSAPPPPFSGSPAVPAASAMTAAPPAPPAGPSLADLLDAGVDLSDPAQRDAVAATIRGQEEAEKTDALARARQLNLPTRRRLRDGTLQEIIRFQGDTPVYFTTHNSRAAISTGASVLQAAPYSVQGTGQLVGIWDGGAVRATHEQFGNRVTVRDGSAPDDHATHVGGTVAASGQGNNAARGMAPQARLNSYDWNSDLSEMIASGASFPAEAGKIQLSNHSYGYIGGWEFVGEPGLDWIWYGSGTGGSAIEGDFGRYDGTTRDSDALSFNLPYYLICRSSGNERNDNPQAGDSVLLSFSGTPRSYRPGSDPGGDGTYRGGHDTIGFAANGKNMLTVGAVNDAVSGAVRSVAAATMSDFSSWGPTDDGRIKPDVVANGVDLLSSVASADTAYATFSGTSMSSPNATGTASLITQFFDKLFPGQALRAATLKGLLIHTADDLGRPGPDYVNGWGLINGQAAADVIQAYRTSPERQQLIEDRLTTDVATRSFTFTWDGSSPLRATLSWTDPAGTGTGSAESRAPRLINNLDLTVTGPTGTTHLPYSMPFVGDWSQAALTAPAVPGKNNTDNVEQVFLASPPAPGAYTATVTVDGALKDGLQAFSLIVTGVGGSTPLPAPTVTSVTPKSGSTDQTTITLTGTGLALGSTVKLTRTGFPDREAFGHEAFGLSLRCRAQIFGLDSGPWNIVVTTPDGKSGILPNAFNVAGPLFDEGFEDGAPGWTSGPSVGTRNFWDFRTSEVHSGARSQGALKSSSGVANVCDLVSPAIDIPFSASALGLSFWHRRTFQTGFRDGAVLEFSLNNGPWFDVASADSGVVVDDGGYDATLVSPNPLAGRRAWARQNLNWTKVTLSISDLAKFNGKKMRVRWRLSTDTSAVIARWFVDDVVVSATVPPVNNPPTITTAPSILPATVVGTEAALSVTATDDGGEPNLVYTWSATKPVIGNDPQRPAQFSENNSNQASATVVTFAQTGDYTVAVTIRDQENKSITSSLPVTVTATATYVEVNPSEAPTLSPNATQQFTAAVTDQFHDALPPPAPAITWSAEGGSITAGGLFTAGAVGGQPWTVTAQSLGLSTQIAGTVAGSSTGGLADWMASYSLPLDEATLLADPDGDGYETLIEYALGTSPLAFSPPLAFTVDPGFITLTFDRPAGLTDVAYAVESSTNMVTWSPQPLEVVTPGNPETVKASVARPGPPDPGTYLRLKVTRLGQ